jgi:short-subunit dehydrogenase
MRVAADCSGASSIHIVLMDLENEASVTEAFEQSKKIHGRIDVLFNNGGISQRSLALNTDIAVDKRLFQINYFSNILLGKKVAAFMLANGGGHIIVTSSLLGKWGFYLRSSYAASKHALHGFYESLRMENEKSGLRVSIVTPGFIATEISKHALTENGKETGNMDNNQAGGITAAKCADQIIAALESGKDDFGAGGKELLGLKLKRFLPGLFAKILRKQSAT